MEQSAGRQGSVLFLLMRPWEDTVCGIDRDRGCRVFPGQSWSVYAFLSAVFSQIDLNLHVKAVYSPTRR